MCTSYHPKSWTFFLDQEEDTPILPTTEEATHDSDQATENTTQVLLESLHHLHV